MKFQLTKEGIGICVELGLTKRQIAAIECFLNMECRHEVANYLGVSERTITSFYIPAIYKALKIKKETGIHIFFREYTEKIQDFAPPPPESSDGLPVGRKSF